MKRVFALVFIAVMLCSGIRSAQASFSREDWYAMGISALEDMTPDAVTMAIDYFDTAGNYEHAKRYEQYAQCVIDILALDSGTVPDLAMTKYRLQDLMQFTDFAASLTENGFPSCTDLLAYISARELEQTGHFAEARRSYLQINDVLDATERRYDLTALAYEEGKNLFDAEDYAGAANALEGLNWDDSEEMYLRAASLADPAFHAVTDAAAVGIPAPVVGDTITLGYYEQDNRLENGIEPIEWLVLEVDKINHRALVISREGLDSWPYHGTQADVTWETCNLRAWLNIDFIEAAFSMREQAVILSVPVDNNAGNDTEDKIFLLSSDEAEKYFPTDGTRKAVPSAYAAAVGAQMANAQNVTGKDSGWWWLRSTGSAGGRACCVRFGGSIDEAEIQQEGGTVRPALWIALQPDQNPVEEEPEKEEPEDAAPEEPLSLVLKVAPRVGCHALSWNAVPGTETYEVSRHKTDTAYTRLAETADTNYDDTDVRAGYRYYYTVIAHRYDGRTVVSNEVVVVSPRVDPRPTVEPDSESEPQPPVEEEIFTLSVEPGKYLTEIHLVWEAVENANSYEILKHTADEDVYDTLDEVDGTVLEYDEYFLRGGNRYYYRVIAYRNDGTTLFSNEVVVQIPRHNPIIYYRTTVADVELTLKAERTVGKHMLTWNEIPGADHYEVWRHMTDGAYSEPLAGDLTGTSYEDQAIRYGYRYYYIVKAIFPNGDPVTSNEVIVVALQRENTGGVYVTVYYVNDKDTVMGSRTVACKAGENFITAPDTYQGLKLMDYNTVCVVMFDDNSLSQKVVYFHYK